MSQRASDWQSRSETELPFSKEIAQVFSFDQNAFCVRVEEFDGREAAMRAAGLE